MAHDDEAPYPGSIDPAGARGTTSGSTPARAGSDEADDVHDDDALADALAAEYTWLATAAIPIVTQPTTGAASASGEDWLSRMVDEPESESDGAPADVQEAEPTGIPEDLPVAQDEPTSASEPEAPVEPANFDEPVATVESGARDTLADEVPPVAPVEPEQSVEVPPTLTFVSPFDPPTASAGVPDPAAAPWSLFPAPDPSQAVELPDGPPQFTTPSDVRDWPAPTFDTPPSREPTVVESAPDPAADSGQADLAQASEDAVPEIVSSVPAWERPQNEPTGDFLDSPPIDSPPTDNTPVWPFDEMEYQPGIEDAPTDDAPVDQMADLAEEAPVDQMADLAEKAPVDAAPIDAEPIDAEPVDAEPIDVEPVDAEPVIEPGVAQREAPNAWTAWAPSAVVPSEWEAAAPAVSSDAPEPDPATDATPDIPADIPADFDSEPVESSRDSIPDPAPEQFPWIVAAAAAAAAQPLVPPVDRDPLNWSITATGKVSYQDDEPQAPAGVVPESDATLIFQEPEFAEPVTAAPEDEPETTEPETTEPESFQPESAEQVPVDDAPRMFAPPPLIEPLSPPQYPAPTSGLPTAPPAYFPVDSVQESDASGSADEELPIRSIEDDAAVPAQSMPIEPSAFDSLFVVPLPTASGKPVPTTSGSITVIDQAYEEELDDDVDDTDRAFGALLSGGGTAGPVSAVTPPSGPISTVRLTEDEPVFFDDQPKNPGMFSLEHSGLEPTPVDIRAGRAIRLFWLWFSANSSVISLALGAVVLATGMSLRQSIVGILGGVALSFFPLALTTLAGKWSGQPTMVVSRATFGVLGNVLPAVLAVISRLFWGAVLLWLLSTSVAAALSTVGGGSDLQPASLATLAIAAVISLLVAFVGYPLLARIQLVLTVVSAVLIVGLIALTVQYIDIPRALTVGDGSWVLAVGGAVLVFSVVGLVWAFSGADLARYQRPTSGGASSMLSATFGTAIPAFVLIAYGAILSASSPAIATGLAMEPVQTLAGLLPEWYLFPLLAATALSLLSGVVITVYSGGLALQSAGVKLPRQWSVVIVGLVLAGLAALIVVSATDGIGDVFRDFATTMAVPTAAWIGIFGTEMMIRNRRFDGESLLRRGGVYPDVRWVNLAGLVLISVLGFGLTTATVGWLSWQGFVFSGLGVPLGSELASTDLGVVVALGLGIILPLVSGVPTIRRQESLRA
ncbi:purine-cytosine permease-like protein [Salinibacterium sp. CAN_S4]|uniref:purine-cytosine permease family protein n=1 Tax=Salinibacterium sp. CAN_S4 TaxID=2787727 RepID=UPI0018EFD729